MPSKASKPVVLVRRSIVSLLTVEILPAAEAAGKDQLRT